MNKKFAQEAALESIKELLAIKPDFPQGKISDVISAKDIDSLLKHLPKDLQSDTELQYKIIAKHAEIATLKASMAGM